VRLVRSGDSDGVVDNQISDMTVAILEKEHLGVGVVGKRESELAVAR
jgi:hypothetical protein